MTAHQLHQKAEEERERDNHKEALIFIEKAILKYQSDNDNKGICEALQSRFLIYKHLFLLKNDIRFAKLARQDAEQSLRIALKFNIFDTFGSCYFRLGEIEMLFEEFTKAIENYQNALKNYRGSKTELGDYRYHLGEALYRNGDKIEGKKALLEGLQEIEKNEKEVDPFLFHVWQSGCYMRLAELLKNDEPKIARNYLKKAEQIVESNEKLVIRKRQIKKLAESFI